MQVAVVIQEMVDVVTSGVAFGVDLERGSRQGETVSALYGVGEGLVQGTLDADTFYVNGTAIRSVIMHKPRRIDFSGKVTGGTVECDVNEALQDIPTLQEKQVLAVAQTVRTLSDTFGQIQDMEWAYDRKGNLFILQTRPVTSLQKISDPAGNKVLWDNANIVESYPGITLPLTFSFISEVYAEVYKQFCLMMGVEKQVIDVNAEAFFMLGHVKGRVYYNLMNWYKLLMLLPGYEINSAFMEQMMGVKEPLAEKPSVVASERGKYFRVARMAVIMIRNLTMMGKSVRRFQKQFNDIVSPLENQNFHDRTPQWLQACYQKLESSLLRAWQPPLVNDFFAMIYYGLLKKILLTWGIDSEGTMSNDLLIGVGDIVSTEPMRRLERLAEIVRGNHELAEALSVFPPSEFIRKAKSFPEFESEFREYLDKFGKRCMGELKLETVPYSQEPEKLIGILRSYVSTASVVNDKTASDTSSRDINPRELAETKIEKSLKGRFLRRYVFRHVLRRCRQLVANRENLRFDRTRLFDVVRNIFLGIGRKMFAEGILQNSRDIFYLTKDEVFGFIDGTGVSVRLSEVVELRKDEYEAYKNSKAPAERFYTVSMVNHGNRFEQEVTPQAQSGTVSTGKTLSGIGCCGGVVVGRARVVSGLEDAANIEGSILITSRTDPGWGPLFPVCRAVVVERGSVLSHAAILTRELGIPSVVGVIGLLDVVHDGDTLEVNGTLGTVRVLEGGVS